MSRAVSAENSTVYDSSYTLQELREAAKELGITGYSTMKKDELIEVLNNADNG